MKYEGITALTIDPAGNFWVGYDKGLVKIQGQKTTTFDKKQGLESKEIITIVMDEYGNKYVGTPKGVSKIQDKEAGDGFFQALFEKAELQRLTGDFERSEKNYQKLTTRFSDNPKQEEALFSMGRLYTDWNKSEKAIAVYQKFLKKYTTSSMTPDVMFALANAGLVKGDTTLAIANLQTITVSFQQFKNMDEVFLTLARIYDAKKDFVNALTYYEQVYLRFSKYKFAELAQLRFAQINEMSGKVDKAKEIYERLSKSSKDLEILHAVSSYIDRDREKVFWDSQVPLFDRFFLLPTEFPVRSIAKDGDTLWIGTFGGGVIKWHPQTNFKQIYKTPDLPSNFVNQILIDNFGTKWFACGHIDPLTKKSVGGLVKFMKDGTWSVYAGVTKLKMKKTLTKKVEKVVKKKKVVVEEPYEQESEEVIKSGLPSDLVGTVYIRGTEIWVGTDKGVAMYNTLNPDMKWNLYVPDNPAIPQYVKFLTFDTLGTMWIGTPSIAASADSFGNYSMWRAYAVTPENFAIFGVNSIQVDKSGNKWFATSNGGIVYKIDGFWQMFSLRDSLASNDVRWISIPKKNEVWFATANGLSKYNGRFIINYSNRDGIPSNNILTLFVDDSGIRWLGTDRAVFGFNESSLDTIKFGKFLYRQTRTFDMQGDIAKEREFYTLLKGLKRFSKFADYKLGNILVKENKLSEAFDLYKKAFEGGNSWINENVLYRVAKLYEIQGNLKSALDIYLKILDMFPKTQYKYSIEYAIYRVGEKYQMNKDYDNALNAYTIANKKFPDGVAGQEIEQRLFELSRIYENQKMLPKSIASYVEFVNRFINSNRYDGMRFKLAKGYEESRQIDKAKGVYKELSGDAESRSLKGYSIWKNRSL
jgi:tetratricopeptide (TPR) repeat protein